MVFRLLIAVPCLVEHALEVRGLQFLIRFKEIKCYIFSEIIITLNLGDGIISNKDFQKYCHNLFWFI